MKRRRVFVIAAVVVAAIGAAVSWSQDFEVSRQSRYRVWYTSPDIKVELGHHWAERHLGDGWLILKVSIAGSSGGVTAVDRDEVRVRSPAGEVIELPSQSEFREGLGSYRVALEREDAWGPASPRFEASMARAQEWFFSPPGIYVHRDTIYPSTFRYHTGPLVFRVPGGVQPGEWTLIVDLEETKVRLPFVLGRSG